MFPRPIVLNALCPTKRRIWRERHKYKSVFTLGKTADSTNAAEAESAGTLSVTDTLFSRDGGLTLEQQEPPGLFTTQR